MSSSEPLKRFYKTVAVENDGNGFFVTLDGRKLKSPSKRDLPLPNEKLASAVAQEWDAQEKHINPLTMPFMSLMSTAIDRIGIMRDGVTAQIAKYAETDLICYWTDDPKELVERQAKTWTPYIDWAKERYGINLITANSVMHVAQEENTLTTMAQEVNLLDDLTLAGLSSATHCTGSLILGLSLIEGHINAQAAFNASQVDEDYQIEQWGEDWETTDRREALMRDLKAVERFISLLK